jgi:hypothetical protein
MTDIVDNCSQPIICSAEYQPGIKCMLVADTDKYCYYHQQYKGSKDYQPVIIEEIFNEREPKPKESSYIQYHNLAMTNKDTIPEKYEYKTEKRVDMRLKYNIATAIIRNENIDNLPTLIGEVYEDAGLAGDDALLQLNCDNPELLLFSYRDQDNILHVDTIFTIFELIAKCELYKLPEEAQIRAQIIIEKYSQLVEIFDHTIVTNNEESMIVKSMEVIFGKLNVFGIYLDPKCILDITSTDKIAKLEKETNNIYLANGGQGIIFDPKMNVDTILDHLAYIIKGWNKMIEIEDKDGETMMPYMIIFEALSTVIPTIKKCYNEFIN